MLILRDLPVKGLRNEAMRVVKVGVCRRRGCGVRVFCFALGFGLWDFGTPNPKPRCFWGCTRECGPTGLTSENGWVLIMVSNM